MIRQGQGLFQKQTLSQKMSPQQIQFIKLLQLPTLALEQRIKEEMELNPLLEEADFDEDYQVEKTDDLDVDLFDEHPEIEDLEKKENESDDYSALADVEPTSTLSEIDKEDWDEFLHSDEMESYKTPAHPDAEELRDLPKPYHESLTEILENQVQLLKLNERELLIADQILGSLDADGYFRRDIQALIDGIAFNHQKLVMEEEVESVLKKIQRLDPVGIAARDLRECLLLQLEYVVEPSSIQKLAIRILKNDWDAFEKKHFTKLIQKYQVEEETIRLVYECIRHLDPRPGLTENTSADSTGYVIPDFEVIYHPAETNLDADDEQSLLTGDFEIVLNQRNAPRLRISKEYLAMWNEIKQEKKAPKAKETNQFFKLNMDNARFFIEAIKQRQTTMLNVMKTIVGFQEEFFRTGKGLKPMILEDIAKRIKMDISTVSRVTNGKYVQTVFGVFELKYFFNEKMMTSSGEEVANREIKDLIIKLIAEEDKTRPFSDQEFVGELKKHGYPLARRTVAKYREQAGIPVARLRREII